MHIASSDISMTSFLSPRGRGREVMGTAESEGCVEPMSSLKPRLGVMITFLADTKAIEPWIPATKRKSCYGLSKGVVAVG